MKEYTVAALIVLALGIGAVTVSGLWRDRTLWLGLIIFAAMTVVADVALTEAGVYQYDRRFNAHVSIGRMPLEDLAYGLALYMIATASWSWGDHNAR